MRLSSRAGIRIALRRADGRFRATPFGSIVSGWIAPGAVAALRSAGPGLWRPGRPISTTTSAPPNNPASGPARKSASRSRTTGRHRRPLPRPRHSGHRLRTHLPASQEGQYLNRAGRSEAGDQGSRRRHSARQLHELRSWIFRRRRLQARTDRRPVRKKCLTCVSGINCNPCVRNGPEPKWRTRQDSNLRPDD